MKLRHLLLLLAAVAVLTAGLIGLWPEPGGFRAWLSEVRDGDNEWGWDLLDREVHRAYGADRARYEADIAGVDWEALVLGVPQDVWSDDGFVHVEAELLSDPAAFPTFLLERRIVGGRCERDEPIGIGVFEDRRPFRSGTFSGGGVTGGQARCNAAFGQQPGG